MSCVPQKLNSFPHPSTVFETRVYIGIGEGIVGVVFAVIYIIALVKVSKKTERGERGEKKRDVGERGIV